MIHDMGFMGMWWLWLIVIIAVLIILVYAINNSKTNFSNFITEETALEILEKHYAKGELSKQELEEKKKNLTE